MMSRLVPVTVTAVCPLKQRDTVKKASQMVVTYADDISLSGYVQTCELLILERCSPLNYEFLLKLQGLDR